DPTVQPHIESAKVEALETTGNSVESLLESRRKHLAAVQEQRTATMGPELRQRHRLAGGWHARQRVAMAVQIQPRGTDGSIVVQDQLFERPVAIAHNDGESLLRDREDA